MRLPPSQRVPLNAAALCLLPVLLFAGPKEARGNPVEPLNLVIDGAFERSALRLGTASEPGVWHVLGLTKPDIQVQIAGGGRNRSRVLRYHRTESSDANVHVDQIVPVKKHTIYEVSAWYRCEGDLRPVLAVARMDWKMLGTVVCAQNDSWTEVRLVFSSLDNEQVRLEWFPGAQGKLYTTKPGTSFLDDVRVRPMVAPPKALRHAFGFLDFKADDEIPVSQRRAGTVGNPLPLRPIVHRNGVLLYQDGGEVALWGANVQTSLSWEYNGRLKPAGVPLKIEALKQVTAQNLDQLRWMRAQAVRVHLLPADFSDRDGNLVDTIFLDALDDLVAQCGRRGLYAYLTLANEMQTNHLPDSFMAGRDRKHWLFDDPFLERLQRYMRNLLEHRNRYTQRTLGEEPAIAVLELINEPGYLDYQTLIDDPQCRVYREQFEAWCDANKLRPYAEIAFREYRYQRVRTVVEGLAKTVRGAAANKPVVWNLNWPGMISGREDVFEAVADSSVDAVSFCCYPGQSDVPSPYWDHPMDLSGKNHLPQLRDWYNQYEKLRWLLGKRFAGKAKLTYEFETFYNSSGYMYPAMARLFRSLGSQIALMWQYTLTPTAQYAGGSHYLNLDGAPEKAISFRIASRAFSETPRLSPYDTHAETEMVFGHVALSFTRKVSLYSGDDAYESSSPTDWRPLPLGKNVREIAGRGATPFAEYEGNGAWFASVDGDRIDLMVRPDVRYTRALWQKPGRWPWKPMCEFDLQSPHRYTVKLDGWAGPIKIERIGDSATESQTASGQAIQLTPGRYRLSRSPAKP